MNLGTVVVVIVW